MSLRKRCSPNEPPQLSDGTPNPLHCPTSPRCDRHWHFYFCLNRRRYRNTTETSDKHLATSIEAKERTRVLELRHGIRRQPDITFKQFATTYLHDYADVEKRSADRYREILKSLNRAFGSVLLHELTEHRIQQWKRERLAGKWRGYKSKSAPKPLKPATVNRELDTLKSILAKLVEWKKLVESPARNVRRFKVDNRRTRILTPDEQRRLLEVSPRKLRALVALALITGDRARELLGLRWEHVSETDLTFLRTKNDKVRRNSPDRRGQGRPGGAAAAVRVRLDEQPHEGPLHGQRHRPGLPAGCGAGRHSDWRRHVAHVETHGHQPHGATGIDDFTVMSISGHSSTRMLERYTHPTQARKLDALASFNLSSDVTNKAQRAEADPDALKELQELLEPVS